MHSKEVTQSKFIHWYREEGGGGGEWGLGLLLGILGVCCPAPQILTLFQTKKRPFSTPVFRPGL